MTKELKILLGLLVLVLTGAAVAAVLYRTRTTPTSAVTREPIKGSYGLSFREELVRPDSHARGPEDAPVLIVEFLDPECEACKAFHPVMKRFLAENEGKVRFVVRYMPFHTSSRMAIAALESAALQGRYWEMLDTLFETAEEWGHQPEPVPAFFERYAQRLGLDEARFKESLVDQRWALLADRDRDDGKTLGVQGTPTVFVNGERLRSLSAESLERAVADAIGATKK